MKVLRKCELETDIIEVGDQITIQLAGFGDFTATAQGFTDKGTLFLFDYCVARHPMNESSTNKGRYECSDLYNWINTVLFDAFPEDMKTRISELSIPSYGQMFGHDNWYKDVMEPDNDEQLSLMKKRKNRIADYNDGYSWYWLRNAIITAYNGFSIKTIISSEYFAIVDFNGCVDYDGAIYNSGVRPVFWLV